MGNDMTLCECSACLVSPGAQRNTGPGRPDPEPGRTSPDAGGARTAGDDSTATQWHGGQPGPGCGFADIPIFKWQI